MPTVKKIILVAAIIAAYFLARHEMKAGKKKTDSIDKINLELTGIVESVDLPESSNGFGIVRTRILQSDLSNYAPPPDADFYYCNIKDGVAEFYQLGGGDCRIGDTIKIDTQNGSFVILRKGNAIKKDIVIYDNPAFYKYLARHRDDR